MGSSAGRRDKTHIAARNYFRAIGAKCHECGKPATIADHDPPLSTGMWAGRYLPHCRSCSARQGAEITNKRKRHRPNPSRDWYRTNK